MVCHDTGAANAFSQFVLYLRNRPLSVFPITSGYAGDVLRAAGIVPYRHYLIEPDESEICKAFEDLKPDAVLAGTSDSMVERGFMRKAKSLRIRCVGYVDWWSRYGYRFSSPGTSDLGFLPDAVAVMDEEARACCVADGIPEEIVFVTGNPYWDSLLNFPEKERLAARSRTRAGLGIGEDAALGLIISSNVRSLDPGSPYGEKFFLESLRPLPKKDGKGAPMVWAMKPHPKESPSALKRLISGLGLDVHVVSGVSGLDAVFAADFVVGMHSSLLFEAALLRKRALSLLYGCGEKKHGIFRIFGLLGIPVVFDAGGANEALGRFVDGLLPLPDLGALPCPIGRGVALENLTRILRLELDGHRTRAGLREEKIQCQHPEDP